MKIQFIFLACVFSATTFAQNLKSGGKLKPEQANMDIRHYALTLDVDPKQKSIKGFTEIDFKLKEATNVLIFDLVNLLKVSKVVINGQPEKFTHENDLIKITTGSLIASGDTKVRIDYGGIPGESERAPWVGGFTWAQDSLGNPWVAITCQGEGAKIYFPCKDHPSDEPNEGATLTITVPKGLYVAGPGLLKGTTTKGNKTTYTWETNYTISNYCILFNVGKYKVVSRPYTTVDGNRVPMEFYVLDYHVKKAQRHLDLFEQSARILEKYFGEYPWVKEKMAICETPHLGMEHQTLNAYGNEFRYQKINGKDFDWLLHHEFGHEWWANKVSNIDWADMWIQEGICTYGDAMFYREVGGEEAYQAFMARTARQTENKKPVVQGKDLDTDVVYIGDIYGKGAFFMHTLRYVIGDEIFFPTLKKLATDPRYTYDNLVNTDDVEKLFSSASGKNLKPLFDFYLRTINKLDITVKQVDNAKYQIASANFDMALPLEVRTDKGSEKITLTKAGTVVESASMPIIDPKVFYLKRVIYE
ncbi:MAG TPA: M1 family metallopeptidase [Chryseosolibacter sp.]